MVKNKILYYVKGSFIWFVLVLAALLIISMINIRIAHFLRNLTDYAISRNFMEFKRCIFHLIGLLILGFSVNYLKGYFTGRFTSKCIYKIRDDFTKRLLKARIDILEKSKGGHILSVFSNDLGVIEKFLQVSLFNLFYHLFMVLASFVYLFMVNKKLTLVILLLVPIIFITTNYLSKHIQKYSKGMQSSLSESNIIVQDTFKGIHTVKAFNLEKGSKEKYNNRINEYINEGIHIDKIYFTIDRLIVFLQLLPYGVFSIYGGYLLKANSITVGDLIAFLKLFDYLYMSVYEIQYTITNIKVDLVSIKRLCNILKLAIEEELNYEKYKGIKNEEEIIEFKNVSFSYDGENDILKNISFSIKKGKQVVILGESGSGKSTLFKLICKYSRSYTGDIKIFGENIRNYSPQVLRKEIGLVSQDFTLFSGSIKENIGLVSESASESEIIRAAKEANAHDFIMRLEKGYNTVLNENANNLSGGQKQRIAIARALLKNSPILLLDEATSALDSKSEDKIQLAISNLAKCKTTIRITHKIENINKDDDVLLLRHGKIAWRGNKDELETFAHKLYGGEGH